MAPDRSDRSLLVNFDNTNDELEATGIDVSERDDITIVSNFPDNTIDNDNVIVSSTDWSSLSKSCKRAKNNFKDVDSGLTVVRNMFMTHLRPLTAVLTLYSKRCCNGSGSGMEEGKKEISLNELKSRTTVTKRALRFAMSCLAPPRTSSSNGDNNNNEPGTPTAMMHKMGWIYIELIDDTDRNYKKRQLRDLPIHSGHIHFLRLRQVHGVQIHITVLMKEGKI